MNHPSSERLSFKEKLAYGLGDTASNFYFQAFNLFLVYYYTDIFGLPSAAGWAWASSWQTPCGSGISCATRWR